VNPAATGFSFFEASRPHPLIQQPACSQRGRPAGVYSDRAFEIPDKDRGYLLRRKKPTSQAGWDFTGFPSLNLSFMAQPKLLPAADRRQPRLNGSKLI